MHKPARIQERFGVFLVRRRFLIRVVNECGETAFNRRTERDALYGMRAIADAVIHFAAREHNLHGTRRDARTKRGQRDMGPRA